MNFVSYVTYFAFLFGILTNRHEQTETQYLSVWKEKKMCLDKKTSIILRISV